VCLRNELRVAASCEKAAGEQTNEEKLRVETSCLLAALDDLLTRSGSYVSS
jgi:hypothetical protein